MGSSLSYSFPVLSPDNFSDAALVVLGHGSTKNAESAAVVFQHATELRRRNLFGDVKEAFWKQTPKIQDVLDAISLRRVFIVPLFISDGYFASDVIPRALGFSGPDTVQDRRGSTLYYTSPVGSHETMTSVILSRARQVIERHPFPRLPKMSDVTLFIAGHGTMQNAESRKAIDRQVGIIRATGEFAEVSAVFMEEDPRVTDVFTLARTRNVIVVPFFIGAGMHTQEDIPVLLGEPERIVRERLARGQPTWRNPTERKGKLIWYSDVVGTDPAIVEIILQRAREAEARHH